MLPDSLVMYVDFAPVGTPYDQKRGNNLFQDQLSLVTKLPSDITCQLE